MLPSRFIPGQQDSKRKDRKSRLDVRPSLLPKPRRPFSTERQSSEMRYPSTAGQRSSSAEPPRHTISGPRLSREASASKLPKNARPRSQQSDRFMTPLRSSQYPGLMTTPRTPSEDRGSRKWQTCFERALAFVTIKDERPLSNASWQRAEFVRVAEALAAREGRNRSDAGAGGAYAGGCGGGGMALVRPLTIARFVDITGALLISLMNDFKLTTDNYVAKLPHLAKRLLYPGTVSKSWLKTVNTLHAFPQALALVGYFVDLVNHVELPVPDDWLYKDKDELSCLRRGYLNQCWCRFQGPVHTYDDIDEEYFQNLKSLLGCDDDKFEELSKTIKKYQDCLEDKEELAAQEEEARRVERSTALAAELKEARAERSRCRANIDTLQHRNKDLRDHLTALDMDIERAGAERSRLLGEVERQEMTVPERTRLLDEIDYAVRVRDSKDALAQQVAKMVQNKETELALWQKKTLDSCVEYKQGLIHLSAQFPDLAALAVDEKELMEPECAARLCGAVETLRELAAQLAERRAENARNKTKLARKRVILLEEIRAKISGIKLSLEREQQAFDSEVSREKADAAACAEELQQINTRLHELRASHEEYLKIDRDLDYWQEKEDTMRKKLFELQEYVQSQREKSARLLDAARNKRVQCVLDKVNEWNEILQQ